LLFADHIVLAKGRKHYALLFADLTAKQFIIFCFYSLTYLDQLLARNKDNIGIKARIQSFTSCFVDRQPIHAINEQMFILHVYIPYFIVSLYYTFFTIFLL
jgi:hypothetical protein